MDESDKTKLKTIIQGFDTLMIDSSTKETNIALIERALAYSAVKENAHLSINLLDAVKMNLEDLSRTFLSRQKGTSGYLFSLMLVVISFIISKNRPNN